MARYYWASETRQLSFQDAISQGIEWDVFVSHASKDDQLADEMARCIRSCGLSAWVDSDHLGPHDDGPGTAYEIKQVIERSYCLLVIVTGATDTSWWVPFEIGVAFDLSRVLSTYDEHGKSLPSFLAAWPRVKTLEVLRDWCSWIMDKKVMDGTKVINASIEGTGQTAGDARADYLEKMEELIREFPGSS